MTSIPSSSFSSSAKEGADAAAHLAMSSEVLKALVIVGFHAMLNNYTRQAKQIFQCIAKIHPNGDCSVIGLAMTAIMENRITEGEALLAEARRQPDTDTEQVKAFHVLALLLDEKIAEANKLNVELLHTAVSEPVLRLGHSLSKELALRISPLSQGWRESINQTPQKN